MSIDITGNCGMCSGSIEKSISEMEGVSEEKRDKYKKVLTVVYDKTITNGVSIHKTIGELGYGTGKVKANRKTAKKRPSCCKNQTKTKKDKKR